MPIQFVPFTGLVPGQEHGSDLSRLENVLPSLGGIRGLPGLTDDGQVADRVISAYVHHYPSGSGSGGPYIGDKATEFHASQTKIYSYSGATFTDLTGALVLNGGPIRRFVSYGNDIWSASYSDAPARRVANAGNFVAAGSSTFIPKGRFVGVVREFIVHSALSNAGRFEDEFAVSDNADPTWYDDRTGTRPSSNAIQKRIVSCPGQIMGFVGGEYGRFWKRNSIHALQFTGGNDIFRLDTVSSAVGTSAPSSVIFCRDGAVRFWGGDGFYGQIGLEEPVLISGLAGISALLIDREAYLNNVSLQPSSAYNNMAEEDLLMFATEDPELGGIFWFYRGLADNPAYGVNRWVYYNYREDVAALGTTAGINFTSVAASRGFMSAATNPPRFIVGSYYDSNTAISHRFRFQDDDYMPILLATQRFTLGKEGSDAWGRTAKITAIQPVFVTRRKTYGSDYQLFPLPELTVRLVSSNDPHFTAQLDVNGDQISPVSQTAPMGGSSGTANDFGWLGLQARGKNFLLEVSVPSTKTALRGLLGFYVQYEVV